MVVGGDCHRDHDIARRLPLAVTGLALPAPLTAGRAVKHGRPLRGSVAASADRACDAASTDPCCSADFTRTKRMAWISPQRRECEKISFEDAQHIGPVENFHRV